MNEVVFLQTAEIEWFDLVRAFGETFEIPFEHGINLLKKHPELGSKYSVAPFRRLLLQNTDWGVFYAIQGRRIIITTILDLRQDPNSIESKLKGLLP